MPLLVRKISKSKWFQKDIENTDEVSADAITSDLRTTLNTLSVWEISNEAELDEAVLAIVSAQDSLETIDVIVLDSDKIDEYDIEIVATPGRTPIKELEKNHRDLEDITFTKLGHIKNHIVQRIRAKYLKRYTAGTLKKLIKKAIDDGILELQDLNSSIQRKVS